MSGGELLALAERCEVAKGSDRELDQDIHEIVVIESALTGTIYPYSKKYTASIDAALTLVPEGGGFLLAASATDAKADVCTTMLGDPEAIWFPGGRAKTPALALCAAALRARAQSMTPTAYEEGAARKP